MTATCPPWTSLRSRSEGAASRESMEEAIEQETQFNGRIKGTLTFLESPLSPFVEVGIGDQQ